MSQTRNQANAASLAARVAKQSAADALFISTVDALIATANTQGRFDITVTTDKDINLQYIFTYYAALGYQIAFPDYPVDLADQPANLFGPYWEAFWQNSIANLNISNPARITINWGYSFPENYGQEEV